MDPTLEVLDVKEREVGEATPPTFPSPSAPSPSTTGFPAPKKRASAFKQQRQKQNQHAQPTAAQQPGPLSKGDTTLDERRGIHDENTAVLNSMSSDEIADAQRDLFAGLDPKLIQALLRRATLDHPATDPTPFDMPPTQTSPDEKSRAPKPRQPTVEDEAPEETVKPAPSPAPRKAKKQVTFDEDAPPPVPPATLVPTISLSHPTAEPTPSQDTPQNTTHFPQPPSVPDLDPSDPDFLEAIHKKFFPTLPADPSKLAWMAPLPTPHSPADRESPYYPGQSSLPVSALRFDFTGRLLPPRESRALPSNLGLHHHGEAPEAAGYTIPELARLARSAVAAQRCLAYQTLGRILYRLGRGDWGAGAGGRDGDEDDLAFALWRCLKEGRVLESLEEEASLPEGRGHLSCKSYAVEAIWLFEKGGWKEKWRGL